jgi:hypothetical protein
MITSQRLAEIRRFHNLVRAAVEEEGPPLTGFQRRVFVDMVDELLAHAEETLNE